MKGSPLPLAGQGFGVGGPRERPRGGMFPCHVVGEFLIHGAKAQQEASA